MDEIRIDPPVNATERYLHAMVVRLDALCHMMSSFLDAYAKQHGLATQSNKVEEKPAATPKRTRTRKG